MVALRQAPGWRPSRDIPFAVFAAAVALGMWRTADQPSLTVDVPGTEVTLVPSDLAFLVLAALVLGRLLGRGTLPEPARAPTIAAGAFSAWLLASSVLNGSEAFVGAAKLLEYGVLALGAVLFVRRRSQLWALVFVIVGLTALADLYGVYGFVKDGPHRQYSYLGAHDFAALSTMTLAVGLAALHTGAPRYRRLAPVAIVLGSLGVFLGAAMASVIGVYLAAGAIVAFAAARRALRARALAITAVVVVGLTGGVGALRYDELGFIEELFGNPDPRDTAASWSQRLIYSYVGGRVFLDNKVVGTGWHGELPPEEFARYLPDAHARFPEQPPHYFPRPDRDFIPQQTYDQVLFELGIVGAVLFLALGVAVTRAAIQVARRWPRGPDEELMYLPAAWLGSLAGALAGAALFGGLALTAMFWLTLGVAALAPSLVPPPRRQPERPPAPVEEPAPAVR